MSKSALSAQETADTTNEQQPNVDTLPGVIGVDRLGGLHRYNAVSGRLVVTDRENEIVHEHDMDLDEFRTEWLAYVGRDRGWIDCWADAEAYTDVVGRLSAALRALDDGAQGEAN